MELARAARGDVEPNPPVGAVLLRDGEVVAEGWHRHFGALHAERDLFESLARAGTGGAARGATLVVTLEPCSTHGKQPPCLEAVLESGVARVVVGAVDPNPAHAGRGLTLLEQHGVQVVQVEDAACAGLLDRFVQSQRSGRPHVLAKWAQSADGALAPPPSPDPSRFQLTGAEANARVHLWRAHLDAIVVGATTVEVDDPGLTARGVPAVRPLRRVVLDPHLRTSPHCQLLSTADETPTWLFATDADGAGGSERRATGLAERGAVIFRVPAGPGWLAAVFDTLRLNGVHRVMVEGGAHTLTRCRQAGLIDQLAVFLTPHRLGPGSLAALGGDPATGDVTAEVLAARLGLIDPRIEPLGPDVLLRGFVEARR